MVTAKRLEVRQVAGIKRNVLPKLLEQIRSPKRKIRLLTQIVNHHPQSETRNEAIWWLRELAVGGNKPAQEFLTKRGMTW